VGEDLSPYDSKTESSGGGAIALISGEIPPHPPTIRALPRTI